MSIEYYTITSYTIHDISAEIVTVSVMSNKML